MTMPKGSGQAPLDFRLLKYLQREIASERLSHPSHSRFCLVSAQEQLPSCPICGRQSGHRPEELNGSKEFWSRSSPNPSQGSSSSPSLFRTDTGRITIRARTLYPTCHFPHFGYRITTVPAQTSSWCYGSKLKSRQNDASIGSSFL